MGRQNGTNLTQPHTASRGIPACVALLALGSAVAPAAGQATLRPQTPRSTTTPDSSHNSQLIHRPRFGHKFVCYGHSSVVYQSRGVSGGLTFVTGSGSFSYGNGWCYGGLGWTINGYSGPYAVFYGASGQLKQIGPTFDQLRTFVPVAAGQTGPPIAPAPPREPTLAERVLLAMQARDYDEAQILARQAGDARLEAFALLGRGQHDEAANMLASAYRRNPELFNQPLSAKATFASHTETRRLLGLAVRSAHRVKTAETWFLVSMIMRAEGRDRLADEMMDRAREAERQQRGVAPREPSPTPPTTPAAPTPTPASPATPAPTPSTPPTPTPTSPTDASPVPSPDAPTESKPQEGEPVVG